MAARVYYCCYYKSVRVLFDIFDLNYLIFENIFNVTVVLQQVYSKPI
jgi:hypothetical protein